MPFLEDVDWQTVSPDRAVPDVSVSRALRDAIEPSRELARCLDVAANAGESVLVVINDPHRATPTRDVLSELAKVLHETHPRLRFRALIATGTHRFSADAKRAFASAVLLDCGIPFDDVAWHDADDDATLADVGGLRVHRWLAQSSAVLGIGSVEPHYFAGVTGAHKTITIGLLARDEIERNHALAMSNDAGVLRTRGNPVFDDISEMAGRLRSVGKTTCAINLVTRSNDLRIVAIAVGDPIKTLDQLLPTVRKLYAIDIDNSVDVIRLRVPPPLGDTFYQADKAIKNNHRAVRDGGAILLEAECINGVGPDAFLSLLSRADNATDARAIVTDRGYRLGDHKGVRLLEVLARGVRIALVSKTVSNRNDLKGAEIHVFPIVQDAMKWLTGVSDGALRRGLVIEDAGNVTVSVQNRTP
jgi:lactate racemase